ncbi:MAG: tetratricopeptide repeat protein [Paludibacteraceae bacterium]|nr:tetratricopeptide repeat protein [Paludibacteraceae bacterium]
MKLWIRHIVVFVMILMSGTCVGQLNTDRLMSVGRNALYFQDYVLSIQYFSKVIQVKPKLAEPYFYRAIAKIELEDYSGARGDLDSVIQRNPFIPMAYYARAYISCRNKEWQSAEKDINTALEYSPDNVTYRINLVNIYEETERYDSAATILDRMIRQSPDWTDLKLERMSLMLQSGDTLGALAYINNIAGKEKRNAEIYGARAVVYLFMNEIDSAYEDCNRAIALRTRNVGTYINRGIINCQKKKFRDAMADYDKAVERDGNNLSALFNRALLRYDLGDYNNALEDLNKIVRLNPDLDEAVYERGTVNALLGNINDAIADFSKIIDRHPSFVPAYYARAEQYDKKRDRKKAYLDRETAFKLMEDHKNGKKQDNLSTTAKVDKGESVVESVANLFVSSQSESASESGVRGLVQNQKTDLSNERNFEVSYYRNSDKGNLLGGDYNPIELQEFVKKYLKGKELYMTDKESPLSGNMSEYYFSETEGLSRQIAAHPYYGIYYVARGLDYVELQDFDNAIEDFTKAIMYGVDEGMVYFMRSCVRYRLWESAINVIDEDNAKQAVLAKEWEMILRDIDKSAEMMPGAGFVWYNKGNMMSMQKDYVAAINFYNKAIDLEPEMGEAYFNRGLTYMLMGKIDKAISDMSKAGELGIYRAYRIIKELSN